MDRIYVTSGEEAEFERVGYFDADVAAYWHGDKSFDGNNMADINTHDRHRGEGLYCTAGGRWVLRRWSNWASEPETFTYVESTAAAADWLLFNGYEDAYREHFGEPASERGPGRPEVGGLVQVRLGGALEQVDRWATEHAITRAEAVRRLVFAGLEHLTVPKLVGSGSDDRK